jgi:phosphomevalonate kinase
MSVSAPGKLFLSGEYGVLHGGTGVVAAVDRRVVARFISGAVPTTPLGIEVHRAVRSHCEESGSTLPEGAAEVDSGALSTNGRKLGLGSSAATAAAAVGALLEAAGREPEAELALAFTLAERAHRAAQGGRGSGADVAAAIFGGLIAYQREPGRDPIVRPLCPLPKTEVVVVSTGSPSATIDQIRAVERFAARDPEAHTRRIREICGVAQAFLRACETGDGGALLDSVRAAQAALEALGREADVPIVTPAFAAAAALAQDLGGAAKPSGAGGGDVGVAFFADPEAARAFRARAPQIGLEVLKIRIDGRGIARGD